jgi:hypothetical protein
VPFAYRDKKVVGVFVRFRAPLREDIPSLDPSDSGFETPITRNFMC